MLSLMYDCAAPRSYFFYDSTTDFSKLKTYSIESAAQPPTARAALREGELADGELRAALVGAIGDGLSAKGYRPTSAPGERADLIVRYGVASEPAALPDDMSVPPELFARIAGAPDVNGLQIDRLTIEAVAPKSRAEVWRGTRVQALAHRPAGVARNTRMVQWVTDLLGCYPSR